MYSERRFPNADNSDPFLEYRPSHILLGLLRIGALSQSADATC